MQDTLSAPPSYWIETILGRLAVWDRGVGAHTVVLWHSILTDHTSFDQLASALEHDIRMILIDGPGHGASAGPLQSFTTQDCAVAMTQVMDALKVDRAIVGGTSWGAMTAAELALAMPDRVEQLIMLNTPLTIDEDHPEFGNRMLAFGTRWLLKTRVFRQGVERSFFSPATLARLGHYAQHFDGTLKRANPRTMANAVRSVLLRGKPLHTRMSKLSMPVLIVAGIDDALYPIKVQEEAAQRIPRGRFAPVPGRHISTVDATSDTATAIRSFLGLGGEKT